MIDAWTVATIVVMASATNMTRMGGYLLLGNLTLSPRTQVVLDAAPGCVLIAVIAPVFMTGRPSDLIALAMTCVVALRLPLLPTVLIGVGTAGLLRHALQ